MIVKISIHPFSISILQSIVTWLSIYAEEIISIKPFEGTVVFRTNRLVKDFREYKKQLNESLEKFLGRDITLHLLEVSLDQNEVEHFKTLALAKKIQIEGEDNGR